MGKFSLDSLAKALSRRGGYIGDGILCISANCQSVEVVSSTTCLRLRSSVFTRDNE